ncbi:MAG TPA: hypothetical protein DEQ74_02620 [Wolbachia sp.]|jgi:ankyrin repeat protein|uniref:ankyrin repeat domain-containing protein n=1 Tax=Wolbachia endosymbiont of Pentalonia nigronervosa TaxID=1301914 RepID=UPI000EC0D0E5|nr:ankyrin repeat domain-containing protein [Wolbachia endosymbiont of Pentalonia nigronervosa]MBD0391667.1 ankyrin repeat domain-containing protein [Wolbachia endosymbiont of Pentalonia nigronervosa]HCE59701.1 hypothetical protein [Wolbachia sp.]
MRDEEWKKILDVVQDLNSENIIDIIKKKLRAKYRGVYEAWKNGGFNLDHKFQFQSRNIESQCTLLHISAYYGVGSVVKTLLKNGANVNAIDGDDVTPLHCAAGNGYAYVVNVLLENGANVNAVDQDGETPLQCAARLGSKDAAEVLLKGSAGNSEGAQVNAVDQGGETSLDLVVEHDYVNTVRMLLAANAKIDTVEDIFGRTPLHWAALRGNVGIVQALLENGADPLLKDKHGYTSRDLTLRGDVEQLLRQAEEKRLFQARVTIGITVSFLTIIFETMAVIWLIKEEGVATIGTRMMLAFITIVVLAIGAGLYQALDRVLSAGPSTRIERTQTIRGEEQQIQEL